MEQLEKEINDREKERKESRLPSPHLSAPSPAKAGRDLDGDLAPVDLQVRQTKWNDIWLMSAICMAKVCFAILTPKNKRMK